MCVCVKLCFLIILIGINPPDFDSQTLAVLRGRLVRFLMRSREVSKMFIILKYLVFLC